MLLGFLFGVLQLDAPLGPQLLELVQRLLQLAPPRAVQVFVGPLRRVEPLADHVELADELAPLLVEAAEHAQDLVGRLLDHEVVVRLADDAEHGEQRERRTEDDLLAQRIVEQGRVVLVDEGAHRLVREEQQHVVDRAAVALTGVVPLGQLAHAQAHVAKKRVAMGAAFGVGAGIEVAQVGAERELHIEVEDLALRQLERVVGQPRATLEPGLLAVVDVLDEPGHAQHVFGHALAPLTARLGAGQGFAQAVGRAGERLCRFGVRRQRSVDLAEAACAQRAQVGELLADPLELGAHLVGDFVEPGVDEVLLRRQVLVAGGQRAGQLVLRAGDGVGQLLLAGPEVLGQGLALEHGGVLERGLYGGITFGGGVPAHLGERLADRTIDGRADGVGRERGRNARPRRRQRDAGARPGPAEHDEQRGGEADDHQAEQEEGDHHVHHHDRGVSQSSGCPANGLFSPQNQPEACRGPAAPPADVRRRTSPAG